MTQALSATMIAAAQDRIQRYQPEGDQDRTAPLLRALLEYSPIDPSDLCNDIAAAATDEQLKALGCWYRDGVLIPMRASGHRTPWITTHPSADSPNGAGDHNVAGLEPAARDQANTRASAAERDGHCCVLTGIYSDKHPDAKTLDLFTDPTVAAHIIPFFWIGGKPKDRPMIWTVVERYAGIKLEELNGKEINKLQNVLTVTEHVHKRFGNLEIWLEAIPNRPNSYYLRKARAGLLVRPDGYEIIFTTGPLPEPRYLALHAACARVLHVTGMAEGIDKLLEDWEARKVLSADGSSAELLDCALGMVPLAIN
ncbi:hypothetical protein FRC10_002981 [Ceratobasidium sp. 414]|nr:hypothetical protein FRC10_002981 [Ceratobasidium sp. 414]